VYDHRTVTIRDEPMRKAEIRLLIRKRRFSCRLWRLPFTEPVDGIRKGYRTTQRYREALWDAAEEFIDLKTVRRRMRCSSGLLHSVVYEQLELRRRTRLYQWSDKVGIDEHYFRRNKSLDEREFVMMIVDHRNHRVMEVVEGKRGDKLLAALSHIPGRENVRFVALDLCDPYKRFTKAFFPNAQLVADKFHVLRIVPALVRHHRGHARAKRALMGLIETFAQSVVPELQTLRRTLIKWRKEVLAYFYSGRLTNARTEGFNLKAKLVKRRGYGYRSFSNYRLRLLNACR